MSAIDPIPVRSADDANDSGSAPRYARLVIATEGGGAVTKDVLRSTTLIGSRPGCNIQLVSPSVSPVHCALTQERDGIHARDLHHRPVTQVNGAVVEDVLLSNGDELRIGTFLCRFETNLKAASSPPTGSDPPADDAGTAHYDTAARLVIRNREGTVVTKELTRHATLVGSLSTANVQLIAPEVTPAHCLLTRERGGYRIRDLRSRNGTRVNGRAMETCRLKNGDCVEIGPFFCRFEGRWDSVDSNDDRPDLRIPAEEPPDPQHAAREALSNERQRLESEWAQLHAARAEHDLASQALRAGHDALAEERDALAEERVSLAAQRDALETARRELDEARKELERDRLALEQSLRLQDDRREVAERQLQEQAARLESERAETLAARAELARELERQQVLHAEQQTAQQALQSEQQALAARREKLLADEELLRAARAQSDGEATALRESETRLKDAQTRLEAHQALLRDDQARLAEQQAQLSDQQAKLDEQQSLLRDDQARLAALQAELDSERERDRAAQSEWEVIRRELADEQSRMEAERESERNRVRRQLDELEAEWQELATARARLDADQDRLKENLEAHARERAALEREREVLQLQAARQREEMDVERNRLRDDRRALSRDRDAVRNEADTLSRERDELREQQVQFRQEQEELRAARERNEREAARLRDAQEQNDRRETELRMASAELERARDELAKQEQALAAEIRAFRARAQDFDVEREVLQQDRSGFEQVVSAWEEDRERFRREQERISAAAQQLADDAASLDQEKADLLAQRWELSTAAERLRSDQLSLASAREQLVADRARLHEAQERLRAGESALAQERAQHQQELERAAAAAAALERERLHTTQDRARAETELKELGNVLARLEADRERLRQEELRLAAGRDDIEAERARLRQQEAQQARVAAEQHERQDELSHRWQQLRAEQAYLRAGKRQFQAALHDFRAEQRRFRKAVSAIKSHRRFLRRRRVQRNEAHADPIREVSLLAAALHAGWIPSNPWDGASEEDDAGPMLLSAGSAACVYVTREAHSGRHVAIKALAPEHVDQAGRSEIESRWRAALEINHPHVIRALRIEPTGDGPRLVMEYVEGITLQELITLHGPLPWREAASYAFQAALGLEHLHEAGFIHREIRPSHLLLESDGGLKVLASSTSRQGDRERAVAGIRSGAATAEVLDYAAPEQLRPGGEVDARSDVYSLGCTLYHALAGTVPFPAETAAEKVAGHGTKLPQPLRRRSTDAPKDFVLAVKKMMAKQPQDRFQTAAELARVLAPFARRLPAWFDYEAVLASRTEEIREWLRGEVAKTELSREHRSGARAEVGPQLSPPRRAAFGSG